MYARTLVSIALIAATSTLAACSSDNVLGLGVAGSGSADTNTVNTARVRFVNATATSLDIATGGVVAAGNGAIEYGASSSCISTNALTPNLAVRIAGTTSVVPGFSSTFQSGVSYTVIAYPGANGATQFATLTDTYTPAAGQSGVRAFNASSPNSSYDVYVTEPAAPLATTPPSFATVTAGTASNFFGYSAGTSQQVRITTAGSKAVLLDVGNLALIVGQNITLVIAPPLVGSTVPRTFLVASC